jgi:hypothetical protein
MDWRKSKINLSEPSSTLAKDQRIPIAMVFDEWNEEYQMIANHDGSSTRFRGKVG